MINKTRMNLVLVEYINRNLGDVAIAECSKYLLEESLQAANITDFYIHEYNMYTRDMSIISRADIIVFAGGGLIKYKRELFYEFVSEIISIAQKGNIPVYFNCVGVEGYDSEDAKCLALVDAVNQSCVKGMTIRDDYELLIDKYLNTKKQWVAKVLDPVSFAGEVYQIKYTEKQRIGLGIARAELYEDYGIGDFSKEQQLQFWKEVIDQIERNTDYEWQIFGNGLYQDYLFQLELLAYIGRGDQEEQYIVKRPTEVPELVNTIAEYTGIIATRLHANILAYSVGVPSIGLVWNDKMIQWGESIGYADRFLNSSAFKSNIVFDKLQRAILEGVNDITKEQKRFVTQPLTEFLCQYGRPNSSDRTMLNIQWEDILIASALGTRKTQYFGMNSLITLENKYREGFRSFEVDVKLTSDHHLVCVNGWNKLTFNRLGLSSEDERVKDNIPSYSCFMKSKYYEHYPTADFEMVMNKIKRMHEIRLFIDMRNNNIEELTKIVSVMKEKMIGYNQKIIIRISHMCDLHIILQYLENVEVSYDISEAMLVRNENFLSSDWLDVINCSQIQSCSINKSLISKELIHQLKSVGKKIYVFNCNLLGEVETLLSMGVDCIGTEQLIVNSLNQLS